MHPLDKALEDEDIEYDEAEDNIRAIIGEELFGRTGNIEHFVVVEDSEVVILEFI